MGAHSDQQQDRDAPNFTEAAKVWARIGLLSFGGPAAQIALMHKEVVEARGWLSERRFLDALSFCMLLPGPEAMQLATFAGWRLHGVAGGLAAGLLFVLPGAAVMLALAALYSAFGAQPLAAALFLGVKAAVIVIVIEALRKIAGRALEGAAQWGLAGLAFCGIFFLALPFPLIVAAAGLWGGLFAPKGDDDAPTAALPEGALRRSTKTAALWLVIWLAPLGALALAAPAGILTELFGFFSRLAVVTFGGAYAVLAYMAQDAVTQYGWLSAGEMLDGLGLAETTPGPLILVTEFVGFFAAAQAQGAWFGALGAAVALWATFAPCFLWIFVGAPYVDWIGGQPRLRGALGAISAAVVGVILNLSIWFALHVFFAEVTARAAGPLTLWTPDLASLDWRAPLLTALAALMSFALGWGLARVLLVSAALGLALTALTGGP